MHDIVRDMALWIKDRFVVFTPGTKAPRMEQWVKVERLSLTTNLELDKFIFQGANICLTTLLMRSICAESLRDDFFLSMPNLKVVHIYGDELVRAISLRPTTWRLVGLR